MSNQWTPTASTTAVFDTGKNIHTLHALQNISVSGISRDDLETTHIGTTMPWRTFKASPWLDPGEISFEGQMDITNAAVLGVMLNGTAALNGSLTLTFVEGSTTIATWTCADAYCKSFRVTATRGQIATGAMTFKLSGSITMA